MQFVVCRAVLFAFSLFFDNFTVFNNRGVFDREATGVAFSTIDFIFQQPAYMKQRRLISATILLPALMLITCVLPGLGVDFQILKGRHARRTSSSTSIKLERPSDIPVISSSQLISSTRPEGAGSGPVRRAEGVPEPKVTLCALKTFDADWNGTDKAGVYTIEAKEGGQVKLVKALNSVANVVAAVKSGASMYCISTENNGSSAYFFTLNADKWTMTGSKSAISIDDVPSDLTVDPSNGKIYGAVYYEDPETYDYGFIGFGEFSLSTHTFKTRKVVERDIYALAADNKGKVHLMFGTRTGWIEPSTLKWDTGLTGVRNAHYPDGYNTMTYDEASGLLYAIVSEEEMKAGVKSYHTYLVKIDPVSFAYTTIFEFPSHQNYAGLYVMPAVVDKEAPKGVTDVTVDFPTVSSHEGTVTFTAPHLSVEGTELTENLSVIIQVGDTEHAIADVQPGSRVTSPSYTFPHGNQTVKVTTANSVDRGETVEVAVFAGEDVPAAVSNLVLDTDGQHPVVSWEAPSGGLNGGKIDSSSLRYKVVRQPGNVLLCSDLTETRYEDSAYTPALEAISYTVTAVSSSGEGEPASTSKAVLGGEWSVPFTETFDTSDAFDLWTVVNSNGGSTWEYSASAKTAQYKYDDTDRLPGDDWLVSPAVRLEAGSNYILSYDFRGLYSGMKESFEILLGGSVRPADMTIPLSTHTDVGTGMKHNSLVFTVPKDGLYHIGVHATSPAYQYILEIDNVAVTLLQGGAPGTVTDFNVVPADLGALSAHVSFTLPRLDADGNELGDGLSVKVTRTGASDPVHVSASLAAGASVSFDDTVDASGIYTYTAVVSNLAGEGAESASTAYIGVDVPDAVENLAITEDPDGKPLVSWTAPAKGRNGGWFDASTLTYDVYRYFGDLALVAEKTTAMSACDTELPLDGPQQFVSYVVVPFAGEASGRAEESPYMLAGAPYAAPLYEGFPKADMSCYPWVSVTERPLKSGWTLDPAGATPSCSDYDGNGGLATFHSAGESEKGVGSLFESPKINVNALTEPELRFALYLSDAPAGAETMQPLISVEGEPYAPLGSPIARTGSGSGWKLYSFSIPAEAQSAKWIRIAFRGVTDGAADMYVDAVSITDRPESPVAVARVTGPAKSPLDNPVSFSAYVTNADTEPSGPLTLTLSCTGESDVTLPVENLAPGETRRIESLFTFTSKGVKTLTATVGSSSATLETTCVDALMPAVTDLRGVRSGQSVELKWNAPSPKGAFTESFENWQSWAIDGIADWTMHDLDLDETYYINAKALLPQAPEDYPNSTTPKAWQVCDAEELCINEWPEGTPHDGKKMLMAMSSVNLVNDDWAVSPVLNGQAQRISFYAKAFTAIDTPAERLQVLVSYTDTEPSAFTPLHSQDYLEIGDEWTLLEFDLPEGSRHFALRCVSDAAFALFVDDVSFYDATVPALSLQRYEVLRDGEPLAETAAASFTDAAAPADKCSYSVRAVYDKGASEFVTVSVELSGVDEIYGDTADTDLYTPTGIYVGTTSDIDRLPSGVYVTRSRKILK